jgi:hypothetical protein
MPKLPTLQQLALGNRRFFTQICLCAATRYRIGVQLINKNPTLAMRQAAGQTTIFLLNHRKILQIGLSPNSLRAEYSPAMV